MPEKSTKEKISSYVILKIVQTAVLFVLFALGIATILLGLVPDADGEFASRWRLYVHLMSYAFLLCSVLSAIAAIILHMGNKNDDPKTLKCFICFGCLTYSMFDKCGGGFPLVRTRMEEIGTGGPLMAPIVKEV